MVKLAGVARCTFFSSSLPVSRRPEIAFVWFSIKATASEAGIGSERIVVLIGLETPPNTSMALASKGSPNVTSLASDQPNGIALLVFGFVENSLIEVISPCSVMYSNTYFSGRLSGSSVLGRWDIRMRERDEVKQ